MAGIVTIPGPLCNLHSLSLLSPSFLVANCFYSAINYHNSRYLSSLLWYYSLNLHSNDNMFIAIQIKYLTNKVCNWVSWKIIQKQLYSSALCICLSSKVQANPQSLLPAVFRESPEVLQLDYLDACIMQTCMDAQHTMIWKNIILQRRRIKSLVSIACNPCYPTRLQPSICSACRTHQCTNWLSVLNGCWSSETHLNHFVKLDVR